MSDGQTIYSINLPGNGTSVDYTHSYRIGSSQNYVNLCDPAQVAELWLQTMHTACLEEAHNGGPSKIQGIGASHYDVMLQIPNGSVCKPGQLRDLVGVIRSSFPENAGCLLQDTVNSLFATAESYSVGNAIDSGKYQTLAACLFAQTAGINLSAEQNAFVNKHRITLPVELGYKGDRAHEAETIGYAPTNPGVAAASLLPVS